MSRFIEKLRAALSRALSYLFESFVPAEDRLKPVRRKRSLTKSPKRVVAVPFSKSKHDLEKLEAAQQKRARRNAKRAAAHYRPEPKKEIADVV